MRQLRERAELSQEALAREVGLTVSAVSKWDQGRSFPRLMPSQMQRLMKVLGGSWDELIDAQRNWEAAKTDG